VFFPDPLVDRSTHAAFEATSHSAPPMDDDQPRVASPGGSSDMGNPAAILTARRDNPMFIERKDKG
jgi:hypothetical protein